MGERIQVVLTGFERGEEAFRAGLMKLGMKLPQIERVIASVPCVLKRDLTLEAAATYAQAFRDAGGRIELRPELGGTPAPDPALPPPEPAPPARPALAPGAALDLPPEDPATPPPTLTESPADTAAATFAPPAGELLDLENPPPGPEPAPGSAPAPASAPSPAPASLAGPQPLPPPPPAKPPAVFKAPNPWIPRGIGIGLVLLVSGISLQCAGKYAVLDRQHAFSRGIEETFQQHLHRAARKKGAATIDDIYDAVDAASAKAKVAVVVHDVQEWHVEIFPTGAVDGAGNAICSTSDSMYAEKLPMGRQVEYMQLVRKCTAPPWIIGFNADVSARWGWNKATVYVEHYAFVPAYVRSGGE